MVSRSSSYVWIAFLLLALLLMISSTDAFISRKWPIPAFPEGVVNLEFPTDPKAYVEPWKDYLVYLAVIFISPIIFTILAFACVSIASICRCCVFIVPNPLRKKNMSVGGIRILALIPFAIGYALLFVATAFGIGFFAWFFIGFMDVRKTSFEVATEAINLPVNFITGVNSIVGEVPGIMDDLLVLVDEVVDVQSTVDTIVVHINGTKSALGGITPYLDNNFDMYTKVKDRQVQMVQRTSGSGQGVEAVDFSAFDSVFTDSTSALGSTLNDTLDTIAAVVQNGTQHLTSGIGTITGHIGTLNTTIMGTLGNLTSLVETYVQNFQNYYSNYVTKDRVDQANFFIQIGEIAAALVIAVILSLVLIIMTIGFLWIFLRCCSCLALLDCFACCAMLLYGVVGGLCLVIWFITNDVCSQAEDFVVKNEEYYNIKPFKFNTPTGQEMSIKYSSALLGVIKCQNNNFLNATGLSLDSFDVPSYFQQFEQPLRDGINQFNATQFLSSMLGNLDDVRNQINIADNFEVMIDQLKNAVNSSISTFFATPPLELTFADFENHDVTLGTLNDKLAEYFMPPRTRANVIDIAPFGYSNGVPGKFADGAGGDGQFAAMYGVITDPTDRNIVWGSLAVDNGNNQIAPGPVEVGLVLLLTKLNLQSPLYTRETYDDYVLLFQDYDNLVQSVNDTERFTKEILDFEPMVHNITASVNATVDNIYHSVRDFIYDSIDTLLGKVDNHPILKCDNVGKMYYTFERSICGNFQIAVGGTAVTALCTVVIMAVLILILFHAQCLSHRKRRSFLDDDDEDETYDAKIASMEKSMGNIPGSARVPPQQFGYLGTQYYVPQR